MVILAVVVVVVCAINYDMVVAIGAICYDLVVGGGGGCGCDQL